MRQTDSHSSDTFRLPERPDSVNSLVWCVRFVVLGAVLTEVAETGRAVLSSLWIETFVVNTIFNYRASSGCRFT